MHVLILERSDKKRCQSRNVGYGSLYGQLDILNGSAYTSPLNRSRCLSKRNIHPELLVYTEIVLWPRLFIAHKG